MCPKKCFSRTTCSLSRYYVKVELDCFNCKSGFSQIIHLIQCLQKEGITVHVFAKKSTCPWGIFNNYREKSSVFKVRTTHRMDKRKSFVLARHFSNR